MVLSSKFQIFDFLTKNIYLLFHKPVCGFLQIAKER